MRRRRTGSARQRLRPRLSGTAEAPVTEVSETASLRMAFAPSRRLGMHERTAALRQRPKCGTGGGRGDQGVDIPRHAAFGWFFHAEEMHCAVKAPVRPHAGAAETIVFGGDLFHSGDGLAPRCLGALR